MRQQFLSEVYRPSSCSPILLEDLTCTLSRDFALCCNALQQHAYTTFFPRENPGNPAANSYLKSLEIETTSGVKICTEYGFGDPFSTWVSLFGCDITPTSVGIRNPNNYGKHKISNLSALLTFFASERDDPRLLPEEIRKVLINRGFVLNNNNNNT
jgi:hypothetical protein